MKVSASAVLGHVDWHISGLVDDGSFGESDHPDCELPSPVDPGNSKSEAGGYVIALQNGQRFRVSVTEIKPWWRFWR